jgi:hypothetical protein
MRTGRLEEKDVADVVQELSLSRRSGRLVLDHDGRRISISVEGGRLVFASSSDPDHRLGPMLLRRGAITLRQMADAVRDLSPGKRFGSILVERGQLDPKELVRGVVDQTRGIILHAFSWTAGEYRLEEGPAAGEAITLNISTPQLVLDGISTIDAWSRIERGCGALTTRYAPAPAPAAAALFKQLTLDVDQAALLRAVKGPRDVEALCADSALNHFEVCRSLWAFRVIGLVQRLPDALPLDEDGLEYVVGDGAS